MKFEVRQVGVAPGGLYPLTIEAATEDDAKRDYEVLRGLTRGGNQLTAKAIDDPAPVKSPVFTAYPEPVLPPVYSAVPAIKPKAAEEVVESEEVLIVQ